MIEYITEANIIKINFIFELEQRKVIERNKQLCWKNGWRLKSEMEYVSTSIIMQACHLKKYGSIVCKTKQEQKFYQ